ncbi:hypothetical protein KAR91_20160 [Candidatus Pacearchaeota archaeon]|nr:hypothetical protein [Candidatus Pacearchaeota archaeon]
MTFAISGGSNVHAARFDLEQSIIVQYARNINDFSLNQYAQITPVTKRKDLYLRINQADAHRLVNNGDEFVWPDNGMRPSGRDNLMEHEFHTYLTERNAPTSSYGDITVEEADWDLLGRDANRLSQQAMTRRTKKAVTLISAAGNYDNTGAVAGTWSTSSTTDLFIKKTIDTAVKTILKATAGVLRPEMLKLVINPDVATIMANSPEIRSILHNSVYALDVVEGRVNNRRFGRYGLPEFIYDLKVVVEDATVETAKKGGTSSTGFVMGGTVASVIAREEAAGATDLQNLEGGMSEVPNFSFLSIFEKTGLALDIGRDEFNKRTSQSVIDDSVSVVTAPASGFLITGVN